MASLAIERSTAIEVLREIRELTVVTALNPATAYVNMHKIYQLCDEALSVVKPETCPVCSGYGNVSPKVNGFRVTKPCKACKGTGAKRG